ncbi:hypothetical protein BraRD5C2_71820 [Bradyrhizobium sp. RD5-C2]|nr:hypothetical protein BraRD5C2_71820 [Bradyrhizobium sp. RD5-C2]
MSDSLSAFPTLSVTGYSTSGVGADLPSAATAPTPTKPTIPTTKMRIHIKWLLTNANEAQSLPKNRSLLSKFAENKAPCWMACRGNQKAIVIPEQSLDSHVAPVLRGVVGDNCLSD